ncbi:hypothetical protein S40288_08301 [Stachybotrys chartarum IBT 40288]|nr:hypothetical protein S40288_08301 [Stachybotrys chartarum IBT 40288]
MSSSPSIPAQSNECAADNPSARDILLNYISTRSPEFRELQRLRQEGWRNPSGDDFFENQRRIADNPSEEQKDVFYRMTIRIGKEMDRTTGVFDALKTSETPKVLDLGMAPGGFSWTILYRIPTSRVDAVTLFHADGGHKVRLSHERLNIIFADINTLLYDLPGRTFDTHSSTSSSATEQVFSSGKQKSGDNSENLNGFS